MDKIRSSYITHAFSGGQDWVEWLHSTALSMIPKKWDEIGSGCKILAFLGARIGRNGCITHAFSRVPQNTEQSQMWLHNPAFSGVPRKGDKIKTGNITTVLSGGKNWAMATNLLLSQGSQQKGTKSERATKPLLLKGPQLDGMTT